MTRLQDAQDLTGVVVVIPSLHPGGHLPEVVGSLLAHRHTRVIVVDDGSGPGYAQLFAQVAAFPGCTVLTHPVNRGKGAALKTALEHCIHLGDVTGVVTADSDGQHSPEDIGRVADELVRSGAGGRPICVLGARDFTVGNIPPKSRFGNQLTSTVVRALTGRRLPDTQTGLRGFSPGLLPDLLRVRGARYDYEMNALMWLLNRRVEVSEVPIATIYHDGANSQTHFRPVRDSVVIYAGLCRQVVGFALTSGLGAIVDLVMFALLIDAFFHGGSGLTAVAVATLGARLLSAAANFTANKVLVFGARSRTSRSMVRYALLAVALLVASILATTALAGLLAGHVVWAKIVVDSALFVASYLIQKRWVFPSGAAPPTRRDSLTKGVGAAPRAAEVGAPAPESLGNSSV